MWMIWLGFGGILAVLASYALPAEYMNTETVIHTVYYALWAHVLLVTRAAHQVATSERWRLRPALKEWAWPVGLGLVGAVLIHFAVQSDFRVLADETNMIGSSLSLYLGRLYRNITEGYFYYDQFHPITTVMDKRPGLFPFLMYLLHCFVGYNAYHGFVVNFIASALSLAMMIRIGLKAGGKSVAAFAVLGLLGTPIFLLGATSSGFEVLNQLLLLATFWQLARFLELPSVPRLELLLLTGLLAAEVRYESILVLLPIGIAALFRFRSLYDRKFSYMMGLIPLLVIPLIWQKRLTSPLNDGDPKTTVIFGFQHLVKNLKYFGEYLVDPRGQGYPMAPGFSLMAIAGLGLLGVGLYKRRDGDRRLLTALVGGLMVLIIAVQLSYYLGDPRQAAAQRIGITYSGMIACLAALAFARLAQIKPLGGLAWAVAFALTFNGLARAAANDGGKALLLFREYKTTLDFVQKFPRIGTLVVADRPGLFTVHLYGAISDERLGKNVDDIKSGMKRKLYTNVLMEQKIFYNEKEPAKPAMPAGFTGESLYEYQNDSRYFVRISRLSPVAEPEIKAEVVSEKKPEPAKKPGPKKKKPSLKP